MKKNKIQLSIIIFFITTHFLYAQEFEWVASFGSNNSDYAESVTIDGDGNIITTGEFFGTVDFDPNTGVFNLTSNGSRDVFIQKLDANGNFIWAKSMGANEYDWGSGIATDDLGNIYTVGNFFGTVDFNPNTGIYNLSSNGNRDFFIQKLAPNGDFMWAKSIGGSSYDDVYSISVDENGSVFVTGRYNESIDFDPNAGTYYLSPAGYSDIFILKLDTSGNFMLARSVGGSSHESGIDIETDNVGNIYITGVFQGTADFDPGSGIFNLVSTSSISDDIFILKLNASGNFVWAKSFGGTDEDYSYSIDVDESGVYTTGGFLETVDFDPGNTANFHLTSNGQIDIFIQKLDSDGNFIWANSMGSTHDDCGLSLTIDDFGDIYTTGYFRYTTDFDPGENLFEMTSNGWADVYIQKLDNDGLFKWVKCFGGINDDKGYQIIVDDNGDILTCGVFSELVDFDPNAGTFALTSNGDYDGYVQKLSQDSIGLEETQLDDAISIYPNPSNNKISLKINNKSDITSLLLTNIIGKEIYNFNKIPSSINVENLSKGVYFIVLETYSGKNKTIRFIKN